MTNTEGGSIRPADTTDDDLIPVRLSEGAAWFPGRDGEPVELGDVDSEGHPSPAEERFGADMLRRLNEGDPR